MSNSSSILAYSLTTLVGAGRGVAGSGRGYGGTDAQNRAPRKAECGPQGHPMSRPAATPTRRPHSWWTSVPGWKLLGGAALGNSEERLIQAMADIEAFNDRVQRLEQASVKLSGAILAYMKQSHIRRCERQDGCGEFSAPAGIRSGIQATARARWRGNPGGSQGAQH